MGRSILGAFGIGAPQTPQAQPQNGVMRFMGAMQQAQQIMQSGQNPAVIAKQFFPDIPDEVMNSPDQVLSYIQQSRGIDSGAIQQLRQMMGV